MLLDRYFLEFLVEILENEVVAFAIAARGDPSAIEEVAPFAIPACALVHYQGDYAKEAICLGDRFFTRSDRHCPDGDCRIHPGFLYQADTWQENSMHIPLTGGAFEVIDARDTSTFREHIRGRGYSWEQQTFISPVDNDPGHPWGTSSRWLNNINHDDSASSIPIYDYSDHFGLVGKPISGSAFTQADLKLQIRDAIRTGAGTVQAAIGQEFQVLHSGLDEASHGTDVWNQIKNRGLGEDSYHQFDTQSENRLCLY